jgi:hypothetical protein
MTIQFWPDKKEGILRGVKSQEHLAVYHEKWAEIVRKWIDFRGQAGGVRLPK